MSESLNGRNITGGRKDEMKEPKNKELNDTGVHENVVRYHALGV